MYKRLYRELRDAGATLLLRSKHLEGPMGVIYLDGLCDDDSVVSIAVVVHDDTVMGDLYALRNSMKSLGITDGGYVHKFNSKAEWELLQIKPMEQCEWSSIIHARRQRQENLVKQYRTEDTSVMDIIYNEQLDGYVVLAHIREYAVIVKCLVGETIQYNFGNTQPDLINEYRMLVEFIGSTLGGGVVWK